MVKVLQVLAHLIQYVLHRDIDLFHDPLIDISYYLLNHFELLEQLATGFQNILGKDVFFTIDPQIWETFLCRVKDLGKVAEGALLIQYLVCFRELFTVLPRGTDGLEAFAKALNLV